MALNEGGGKLGELYGKPYWEDLSNGIYLAVSKGITKTEGGIMRTVPGKFCNNPFVTYPLTSHGVIRR